MNPTGSFFRFLLGFLTFISVSFAVTYTVNEYAGARDAAQQQAAAVAQMLEQK